MRSTFYTANQTQTKFPTPHNIPNANTVENFDPMREVKSSFSYQRPKYEYSNLMVEKITHQAKNRELAEKRNQEEMKEFMNEFGISRSRFLEEVQKKRETKQVINHYEEKAKLNQSLKEESDEDELKPVEAKTIFVEDEASLKKLKSLDVNNDQTGIAKINTNFIKNLGPDYKLKTNSEEIVINIRVKEDLTKDAHSNLSKYNKKFDKIPSEVVSKIKSADPIFNARHTYSKMIDVKEIDQPKTEYKKHYKPLSAFDSSNFPKMNINKKDHDYLDHENSFDKTTNSKTFTKLRPSTGYQFVRENFDGGDLLKQRRLLSGFKVEEFNKLKATLIKNKNTTVCFASLRAAFVNPIDNTQYPKFFLPSAGGSLLSRPVDTTTKKRPKSKKKKK
jgi:hypothetical protein